ncbi:uncharacterized protein LOC124873533 isoform X3 [Girardinichthys multiradiatus]|uniref:uncharacterized protein LOC124873533 isoform X3 n=1 Tax=Girardinichthys multiradiatus TaxID=208333 RepID=UPI001FACC2B5|nr:uncharacterized protein LOC124873533 isoform X3 [Girardinichthys multiradiatus]
MPKGEREEEGNECEDRGMRRRSAFTCGGSRRLRLVLLYASPSWLRRIFGIPTDRELHRTSYLAGSPNGSEYRFSRKPCPPYHRGLIPGSRRHRAPGQLSVLTRPFPGGYPSPISQADYLHGFPTFVHVFK